MATNPDNLPWNYIYLGTENDGPQLLVTDDDDDTFLVVGINPFPAPPAYNGSGGNKLLCTSYIVDMGFARLPADAQNRAEPDGPTRDRQGRAVRFD